jgi:hypothetical protein
MTTTKKFPLCWRSLSLENRNFALCYVACQRNAIGIAYHTLNKKSIKLI